MAVLGGGAFFYERGTPVLLARCGRVAGEPTAPAAEPLALLKPNPSTLNPKQKYGHQAAPPTI